MYIEIDSFLHRSSIWHFQCDSAMVIIQISYWNFTNILAHTWSNIYFDHGLFGRQQIFNYAKLRRDLIFLNGPNRGILFYINIKEMR